MSLARLLTGGFLIAHGLVHVWYVVLSRQLVPFEKEMGWTGQSWLLSPPLSQKALLSLAVVLFSLSALIFSVGGIGYLLKLSWWKPALVVGTIISAFTLLLFWDGSPEMLVQKGVIGVLIDIGVLVAVL